MNIKKLFIFFLLSVITLLCCLVCLLLTILIGVLANQTNRNQQASLPGQVACTMDAAVCPDGSFVGRDPNRNCKFERCPDGTQL